MKNSRTPVGASLLIAIVFVSAFMFVVAGLVQAVTHVFEGVHNRETAAKVAYLLESTKELAGASLSLQGVGWNKTDTPSPFIEKKIFDLAQSMGFEGCGEPQNGGQFGQTKLKPCAGVEVLSRSSGDPNDPNTDARLEIGGQAPRIYYSVPAAYKEFVDNKSVIRGTGDAASDCQPVGSDPINPDADDPCHWNRLRLGESVEVPLFWEDQNTVDPQTGQSTPMAAALKNPGDTFILRVRTPCPDGMNNNCPANYRPDLYPSVNSADYASVAKDPVLIQWSITDVGKPDQPTLLANDDTVPIDGLFKRIMDLNHQNTEISGGRINLAKSPLNLQQKPPDPLENFQVLKDKIGGLSYESNLGKDLKNKFPRIADFISSSSKPVLRLSMVGQPQRIGNKQDLNDPTLNLPYLEYQVLATQPVSDAKSFLRGWVELGGIRKEFFANVQRAVGLGGFAVENF